MVPDLALAGGGGDEGGGVSEGRRRGRPSAKTGRRPPRTAYTGVRQRRLGATETQRGGRPATRVSRGSSPGGRPGLTCTPWGEAGVGDGSGRQRTQDVSTSKSGASTTDDPCFGGGSPWGAYPDRQSYGGGGLSLYQSSPRAPHRTCDHETTRTACHQTSRGARPSPSGPYRTSRGVPSPPSSTAAGGVDPPRPRAVTPTRRLEGATTRPVVRGPHRPTPRTGRALRPPGPTGSSVSPPRVPEGTAVGAATGPVSPTTYCVGPSPLPTRRPPSPVGDPGRSRGWAGSDEVGDGTGHSR